MIEDIYNWLQVAGVPKNADLDQFLLWQELMLEEIGEMADAFRTGNIEEMKDAYADILVVATNWPYMAGITPYELNEKIERVSYSNWSKFCTTEEEAQESVHLYSIGKHPSKLGAIIEAYYQKVGDYYIIKRSSDSKILKSLNFQNP